MPEVRLGIRSEQEIKVNFPFLVTITHPALGPEAMFRVTEAFDLYEMRPDPAGQGDRVKDVFLVDVLEIAPKATRMKITPAEPIGYTALGKYLRRMLSDIEKEFFAGKVHVASIAWEVGKTGVASDLRGMLRTVQ